MRFVIIGSPRTGSSHLVNMLGAHPEVLCNGNIFHPKHVWVFWPDADLSRAVKAELREQREADPERLTERVFSTNYGRPHVGFKIFEGQNDRILSKLIEDDSVRKVVLYRKNVLASYASKLIARKTGEFDATDDKKPQEAPKVKFIAEKFMLFHNGYNKFYREVITHLVNARQNFHFINYEEINDPYLFGSLLNFIGANPLLGISKEDQYKIHMKQNSSNICSRFANHEEVEQFLRQQGLLHWAQEGETSLRYLDGAPPLSDGSPGPTFNNLPAGPEEDGDDDDVALPAAGRNFAGS